MCLKPSECVPDSVDSDQMPCFDKGHSKRLTIIVLTFLRVHFTTNNLAMCQTLLNV